MNNWNEIKTAYRLAKLKTLSATAQDMGVHRSTVMRHIDSLESRLAVKLFQRNDKGYLPTEAGLELMRLGEVTDNQFNQLSAKLQDQQQPLSGTIKLTCVSEMASLLMPAIRQYQQLHPQMTFDIIGDIRNFNLEYGEADIAIRAGDKPTTLDNVVYSLAQLELVPCAHQSYIEQYGLPNAKDIQQHKFIALKDRPQHLHWNEWIYNNAAKGNIVMQSSDQKILSYALYSGIGVGILPRSLIEQQPELTPITIAEKWHINIWALVHRDMLNMPKIRKFLQILQQQKNWPINHL